MLKTKTAISAALAGAFILGATVIAFSSAQTNNDDAEIMSHSPKEKVSTSFSGLQEEEIGDIIRAYLMENPEVIIDAVNEYSAKQRLAAEENIRLAAADNLDKLLDPATAYVAGKNVAKAKIAVVELYDYHCGYCKRAAGLVGDMVKNDADVKVVFRELPILRQESEYAAEMALAARSQGKFLDYHFALFETSGVLTKERLSDIAREEGLDVAKMEAEIDGPEISSAIDANHMLAQKLGIDGTPAFVIAATDGSYIEIVSGFAPELVEEKIKEAKKAVG